MLPCVSLPSVDGAQRSGILADVTHPGACMPTENGLRYIDSDGHILEHPTAMPGYAPAKYRDRIWHIETDDKGVEWLHYDGSVTPA